MTQENKSPKEAQDFATNSGYTNVKKGCEMNRTSEHRRKLSEIPKHRVLRFGDQLNDACLNLAHDPCSDSWKTLLFKLQDAWSEVRDFCPEISLDEDFTQGFDS